MFKKPYQLPCIDDGLCLIVIVEEDQNLSCLVCHCFDIVTTLAKLFLSVKIVVSLPCFLMAIPHFGVSPVEAYICRGMSDNGFELH